MNLAAEFNSLNGKTVSRTRLESLLAEAQREKYAIISNRIQNVLNTNDDDSFDIEINEPMDLAGLSGVEQEMLLPMLDYISEPDDETGLNKAVTPNEIYSFITDMLINTINKVGHLPWQKEWTGSGSGNEAKNLVSLKPYSGANFFILNYDVKFDDEEQPYLVPIKFIEPYYLTFPQIEGFGAILKPNSQPRRIIFYTMVFNYKSDTLKINTTDRVKFWKFVKENGITKEQLKLYLWKIPVLRYYNVYRADDCTGLKFPPAKPKKQTTPIEQAQDIIDGYKNPPRYTNIGDRAYYRPATDELNMPTIEAFSSEAFYYSTFFHEAVHSTGAEKRLHRDFSGKKGGKEYAFEELIAELGAVFLSSEAGILFHTKENSAKYLKSWNSKLVNELENDNRFFLKASASAQKAVNHILGRVIENDDDKTEDKKEVKKRVAKPKKTIKKPIVKPSKKQGLNAPIIPGEINPEISVTPIAETPVTILPDANDETPTGLNRAVPIKTKEPQISNKTIAELEKMGFVSASKVPDEPKDVFYLDGEIGKFLQKLQPYKALILIKGTKHTSKTQLAMQIANGFAEIGMPVAYIDNEQGGMESKDTIDSINRNTTEQGRKLIAIKGHLERPLEELKDFCKHCEVIVADSVTDLGLSAEQLGELRVSHPKIIWVFISQVKENGEMYGGNKMNHNPTVVIECHPAEHPRDRIATLEKNRGNDISLMYSIYNKKLIQKQSDEKPTSNLSFRVK